MPPEKPLPESGGVTYPLGATFDLGGCVTNFALAAEGAEWSSKRPYAYANPVCFVRSDDRAA
jgi:hypothetical protein